MIGFDIENSEPDVKDWIYNYVWPAAQIEMRAGQKFVNSRGQYFIVLEDSPIGETKVKIGEIFPLGRAVRYMEKAIILI